MYLTELQHTGYGPKKWENKKLKFFFILREFVEDVKGLHVLYERRRASLHDFTSSKNEDVHSARCPEPAKKLPIYKLDIENFTFSCP